MYMQHKYILTPLRLRRTNKQFMLLSHLDQEVQARHSLTSGLNLELKVTFVLMQRSVSQAASSATYPPAALHNDNVCACGDKQKVNKQKQS